MSAADISLYSFTVITLLVMYMIIESTEWGLSIIIPYLTKHPGDRRALARLLRPGFKGTELCLAAGILLLMNVFPSAAAHHTVELWIGVLIVLLSLVTRLAMAWGCNGETAAARLLAWGNSLLGVAAIAISSWMLMVLLMEISVGALPPAEWIWMPLTFLASLWGVASLSVQGAYVVAHGTENPLAERARAAALVLSLPMIVLYVLLFIAASSVWNIPDKIFLSVLMGAILLAIYVGGFVAARRRHPAWAGWLTFGALFLTWMEFLFTMWNILTEFVVGTAVRQYNVAPEIFWMAGIAVAATMAAKLWRWNRPREQVLTGYEWETLRSRHGQGK